MNRLARARLAISPAAAFIIGVWIFFLGAGFWRLFVYSNTPGEGAKAPTRWPSESSLPRDAHRANLVLFAHPHCPCSHASIGELERLASHFNGKVMATVAFFKPESKGEDWVKGSLWKKTKAIPGVQVVLDEGGIEADRFGAKTSGQTLLYDAKGSLAFSGGITPGRGHMGDSQGRDLILAFINIGKTAGASGGVVTKAFGCSLKNPDRAIAGAF